MFLNFTTLNPPHFYSIAISFVDFFSVFPTKVHFLSFPNYQKKKVRKASKSWSRSVVVSVLANFFKNICFVSECVRVTNNFMQIWTAKCNTFVRV